MKIILIKQNIYVRQYNDTNCKLLIYNQKKTKSIVKIWQRFDIESKQITITNYASSEKSKFNNMKIRKIDEQQLQIANLTRIRDLTKRKLSSETFYD